MALDFFRSRVADSGREDAAKREVPGVLGREAGAGTGVRAGTRAVVALAAVTGAEAADSCCSDGTGAGADAGASTGFAAGAESDADGSWCKEEDSEAITTGAAGGSRRLRDAIWVLGQVRVWWSEAMLRVCWTGSTEVMVPMTTCPPFRVTSTWRPANDDAMTLQRKAVVGWPKSLSWRLGLLVASLARKSDDVSCWRAKVHPPTGAFELN